MIELTDNHFRFSANGSRAHGLYWGTPADREQARDLFYSVQHDALLHQWHLYPMPGVTVHKLARDGTKRLFRVMAPGNVNVLVIGNDLTGTLTFTDRTPGWAR